MLDVHTLCKVHPGVADLQRSIAFSCDTRGLSLAHP
jgi:hypothetical protein